MSEQVRFRAISIDLDTYKKLEELAARGYRSVPKEIARLADLEIERVRNGVEEAVAVPEE